MFDTCKSKAVETLSTHNMPIMRAGCEEKVLWRIAIDDTSTSRDTGASLRCCRMGLLKRYAPVVSTSLLLAGAWLWDAIVTHSTANRRPECAYEDVTVQ
jgi:hypothetical protein